MGLAACKPSHGKEGRDGVSPSQIESRFEVWRGDGRAGAMPRFDALNEGSLANNPIQAAANSSGCGR